MGVASTTVSSAVEKMSLYAQWNFIIDQNELFHGTPEKYYVAMGIERANKVTDAMPLVQSFQWDRSCEF